MALLDAIFEGLVDEEDGALRESCAVALREFLLWSAKHVKADAPNLNAASLLRRLFERLTHPKPYQRRAEHATPTDWLMIFRCTFVLCAFVGVIEAQTENTCAALSL